MMMLVLSRCGIATAIGFGAMARMCGGHEHNRTVQRLDVKSL